MGKLSLVSAVICVACCFGADAGGRQTWMTGYYSAGNTPKPRFSFLDRDGNINMQCGVLEENNKEVGVRLFNIKPPKVATAISNNVVLLEDGSVWVLYFDWIEGNNKDDYVGDAISGGLVYDKQGKQIYKDICFISDKKHGMGVFLRKIIDGGVKKVLAADHFVLALRDDGVVLGFGAEEGNGFGNPDGTIAQDRMNGPWYFENLTNIADILERKKYENPDADVSALSNEISEEYSNRHFLLTAARKISYGSLFIKEFMEFEDKVIDIAANDSLFGVLTKKGQIYIWGWGDMYGFTRSLSGVVGGNEKFFKVDHSISKPQKIFFGKQYVFVSDADSQVWVWGGRRHEWPGPYGYMEFPSLEALDIKSTNPRKVSIPLNLDFINPITTKEEFYEPYGPISFLNNSQLMVGYIFSDIPHYPSWLNQDELEYSKSWHGRPLFLSMYNERIVDVSAAYGRKIVSSDIFFGMSIDEDDNLYRYERPEKGRHIDISIGERGFVKKELGRDGEIGIYFSPPVLVPVKKTINPAEAIFK